MKNNSHQLKWFVDASLFTGFWIASLLDLTGLALHQWLGLAVGILAGYHFLTHWTWVKSVTQRWSGHTSGQARGFYLIDTGLFAGFSLILLTGLVISTWFDLTLASYAAWRTLHVAATITTLGLVVVKIGLHWRWIVKVGGRLLHPDLQPPKHPLTPKRLIAPVNTERRNFLRLMGVVSIAALVAAHSALEGDDSAVAQVTNTNRGNLSQSSSQSTSSLDSSGSSASSPASSASSASSLASSSSNATSSESSTSSASSNQCQVHCNRRCSYPGHCRRYADSNSNGRCDFGECQT